MQRSTKAPLPPGGATGQTDWQRLDTMTDAEVHRAALSDPDNPPLTEQELKRMRRVVPRGNGLYGPPPKR